METSLEMVRRHVRESDARVIRQMEIIERLRDNGRPVEDAEALLETLKETLQSHRHHLLIELQVHREA